VLVEEYPFVSRLGFISELEVDVEGRLLGTRPRLVARSCSISD
jgi:hypothetical protein